MFIYSIRSQTIKFICIILLSAALMITLVALIPTYGIEASSSSVVYSDVYSEKDRIAFINQFGWVVDETPVEEVNVKVPNEFDTVYIGYNELQKKQGLNLTPYKGKEITRYTYNVKNYEGYDGTVYINLLSYRGKIIGGDVCSADTSGFVSGFERKS